MQSSDFSGSDIPIEVKSLPLADSLPVIWRGNITSKSATVEQEPVRSQISTTFVSNYDTPQLSKRRPRRLPSGAPSFAKAEKDFDPETGSTCMSHISNLSSVLPNGLPVPSIPHIRPDNTWASIKNDKISPNRSPSSNALSVLVVTPESKKVYNLSMREDPSRLSSRMLKMAMQSITGHKVSSMALFLNGELVTDERMPCQLGINTESLLKIVILASGPSNTSDFSAGRCCRSGIENESQKSHDVPFLLQLFGENIQTKTFVSLPQEDRKEIVRRLEKDLHEAEQHISMLKNYVSD